jgi:hypothetical protein
MTENPYAIPVEDLVRGSRVPVAEQVVEQRWAADAPDWSAGGPVGDADGCDADGD